MLFPITDEIAAVARKLVDDPGVPKSIVTELRILLRRYDHAEATWIVANTPEDPPPPRAPATTVLLVLAEVPIDETPLPPPAASPLPQGLDVEARQLSLATGLFREAGA